jgi:hypothetical protein
MKTCLLLFEIGELVSRYAFSDMTKIPFLTSFQSQAALLTRGFAIRGVYVCTDFVIRGIFSLLSEIFVVLKTKNEHENPKTQVPCYPTY